MTRLDALCWRRAGAQGDAEQVLQTVRGWLVRPHTARAAGGAAGHYGVNHGADRPTTMGLNYDA